MRRTQAPTSLLAIATRQSGLVSASQCDEAGLDRYRRHRMVAAGRAALITRGVLDLTVALREEGMAPREGPEARRRRAALLALLAHGPAAVAVGPCALALLGVQGLPVDIRPEVWLPPGSPRRVRAGIVVRSYRGAFPTFTVGAFRVAAPRWALAQALPGLGRDAAIAALDSAVQRGLVGQGELDDIASLCRHRTGAARVRGWLELVDGRAQSPLETRARLQCVDAGVPPDDLQVPIRDAARRVIARGDLGWKLKQGRWLVVEIDGAGPHSAPRALFGDRERQNAIVATGRIDMLRFTARDVGRRNLIPAAVAAQLAADALRSVRFGAT